MVPARMSMKQARLRDSCHRLQACSIALNDYSGSLLDIAFDLITVDTFVAGLASKILDRQTLTPQERQILLPPFLAGSIWNGHEIRHADLTGFPELLAYAQAIEQARVSCLDAVGGCERESKRGRG
jgi:hypothetical protein